MEVPDNESDPQIEEEEKGEDGDGWSDENPDDGWGNNDDDDGWGDDDDDLGGEQIPSFTKK